MPGVPHTPGPGHVVSFVPPKPAPNLDSAFNSFEGQTNGATITGSDTFTDGSTPLDTESGTRVYDNAHPIHGSMGGRVSEAGATSHFVGWYLGTAQQFVFSGTDANDLYWWRGYYYKSANPTQFNRIWDVRDQNNNQLCHLRMQTDGTIRFANQANTLIGASSAAIPSGQPFRLEIQCILGGINQGYLEARVWWTDIESTGAPDTSINVTNVTTGGAGINNSIHATRTGVVTAPVSNTWDLWFDDLAYALNTGWIGPIFVPAVDYLDSGTVGITITPSSVDAADLGDTATVPVMITPSGADVYTTSGTAYTDAGTVTVKITPNAAAPVALSDAANQTTAGSWGTPEIGPLWAVTNGTGFAESTAFSGSLQITPTASSSDDQSIYNAMTVSLADAEMTYDMFFDGLWLHSFNVAVGARTDNAINGAVNFNSSNIQLYYQWNVATQHCTVQLWENDFAGGLQNPIGVAKDVGSVAAGEAVKTRWSFVGNRLRFKVWNDARVSEPAAWDVDVAYSGLVVTRAGGVYFSFTSAGNATTVDHLSFDNIVVTQDISPWSDISTVALKITPSGVDARDSVDTNTVYVDLQASSVDTAQFVDAVTVPVTITPSAADTAQFVDTGTVRVSVTPSSVDTAQFVDVVTVPVTLTPSAVEVGIIHTDAATVSVALTPSAVESAQFVDSSTVGMVLTPSAVEAAQFADAVTVRMAMTPSSADILAGVETGSVLVDISGSSTDVAADIEAVTARVTITPSVADILSGIDSDTSTVVITPGMFVIATTYEDVNEVDMTISASSTDQAQDTDANTVYLSITPGVLSEFAGDGDIVPVHVIPSVVEGFAYEEASVVSVDIDASSAEALSLTTFGTADLRIVPGLADEHLESQDTGEVYVTITPGLLEEERVIGDYLLVGVVSNHYTALLRDTNYVPTMQALQYTASDVVSGYSIIWHGRGDE
jgi:hypothetical protein